MSGIVDFHSHILPGIDDGSASLEESADMLKMEAEQGITCVAATPHFYARQDNPEAFLKRRAEAERMLREEMEKHDNLPRLIVGAEVQFFSGMSHWDILQALTIDQKKGILIEMPHTAWTPVMYNELEEIRTKQGLIPIIAHVDRYIRPFQMHGIPERLSGMPVLVQANASFFLRRSTVGMAMRLLKEDKLQILGSDCHNLKNRVPNLGPAVMQIEKKLGSAAISRINSYEEMLLNQ